MTTHDTRAFAPETAQPRHITDRARDSVRSAREDARAKITQAITDVAREHLSDVGPANLSLRAVARDLDMASSAVYRYFKNRDELLTALIFDAYHDLGDVAEETAASLSSQLSPRHKWVEVAVAVRAWAVEHPHEFALIYGSPIPGYAGPQETHTAASRMPLALVGVVRDAVNRDEFHRPADHHHADQCSICATKAEQKPNIPSHVLAPEVREIVPEMDDAVILQMVKAWAGLLGIVSFEIFGYLERAVTDSEAYFRHIADQVAWELGLD